MSKVKLGIMASGSGSNAEAILKSCREGKLDAECTIIVSNNLDAGVHNHAKNYNVPSLTINRQDFKVGKDFADKLIAVFNEHNVDLILLAGYMRKIPKSLLRAFPQAVLNIHPALLPKHGGKGMYGIFVHEDVIAKGDKFSGVTIHYVDAEYDRGPVLHQVGDVEVLPEDTPSELAKKVLKVEHVAYSQAVQKWIEKHR